MEDKVTSRVCNLMLNIMHASLLSLQVNGCIHISLLLSDLPQLMASNESQTVQPDSLQEIQQSRKHKTQTDLPYSLYMMGFVPFATPQTFSRMVVLPALALPMTRMRKCGHR